MKLATLRDGSRDGRLVVVSQDVTQCSDAHHVAPTLQHALDDWDRLAPHLGLIARGVESGGQPLERFHERAAMAPLPRAFQWIAATPGGLIQRASDRLSDPRIAEPAAGPGVAVGCAAIVGDVPAGIDRAGAAQAIRLLLLYADAGTAAPSLSPVATSPEDLGELWQDGAFAGQLILARNGRADRRETGPADLAALIAEAARLRPLAAGSLVSAEPVGPPVGFEPGDLLRLEMRDGAGHSAFGAIEIRNGLAD